MCLITFQALRVAGGRLRGQDVFVSICSRSSQGLYGIQSEAAQKSKYGIDVVKALQQIQSACAQKFSDSSASAWDRTFDATIWLTTTCLERKVCNMLWAGPRLYQNRDSLIKSASPRTQAGASTGTATYLRIIMRVMVGNAWT